MFLLSVDVDPDEEHAQWIKAACYRCLLYMGDLGTLVYVFGDLGTLVYVFGDLDTLVYLEI